MWPRREDSALLSHRSRAHAAHALAQVAATLFGALALAPLTVIAQTTDQVNQANSPLTPSITANLQDLYAPRLYDSDGSSNSLLLRGVLPHALGGMPQIVRGTLPITSAPDVNGNTTGLGDLNLFDLVLFKQGSMALGIGPQLTVPTATDPVLGTGKWQAGLAAVVVAPQAWGLMGALVTWQHSFAGPSDRPTQNNLVVQPLLIYNLPQGVYLRSTANWNFDLARDNYVIPIGAGAGKVFLLSDGTTINVFAEPQWTIAHHGAGQPEFQVFMGVNLQFPLQKKRP
jgi:hypothetical protein